MGFMLVVLIVSACQLIQPIVIAQTLPESNGLRPDAPAYAVHGPFWVGYRPPVGDDGTTGPPEISIWYPALNPAGAKEEATYEAKFKINMLSPGAPSIIKVINGHALLNAEIDGSKGPYPLVIFSHGFSASAADYSVLAEHYASYGFIVLAPEHMEKFDPSYGDLWKSSIDRPADIKKTLDYAEELTAPEGKMAGIIDMGQVAVVGHSYGGYTALAMAGAQYDLAAYNTRCAKIPEDSPLAFLCTSLVTKEADMATRAGLNPMPEGLWPSFGDSRVKAIIPMAGDAYLFDQAGLSNITIPVMAIGGTADTATPYAWGSKPTYDYVSSEKRVLVGFVGAEHMIFSTPCENINIPGISKHPLYENFCFDPVWDKDRALDLIHHFSTAFLLDTLKGDQAAHAALLPDAVRFPGIEYTTTLK